MISVDSRCVQLVSDTAGVYLSAFKSENIDIDLWPRALCFVHVPIMVLFILSLDRVIS